MTDIQQVFWAKGSSGLGNQLLKLGKKINNEYRSIQPIHPQFDMGTNPRIEKFRFIKSTVDLMNFFKTASGKREEFDGFKLLVTNDEGESYYLQLGYRVLMYQSLVESEELQEAMGVKKLPKSSAQLDLTKLRHTPKVADLFNLLETRANSFLVMEELNLTIKGTIFSVPGTWKELHTPTKF